MNNYRKLATSILTIAAFAVACAFTTIKPPANFSGDWKLNESKSDLGQFGMFAPKKLKVGATDNSVTIETTSTGRDGQERTTKETLGYDGKEVETALPNNGKKKSTVKWSDDGKTMTVNSVTSFDMNGQTFEVKAKQDWQLSEDGKTLTIQSNSSTPRGDIAMKLVYDKQ